MTDHAAIVRAVGSVLKEQLQTIGGRLIELDRRLAEVEGRQLEYRGTWRPDVTYARGTFVSHASCLWHADQDQGAGDMPGRSNGWTLSAKVPR